MSGLLSMLNGVAGGLNVAEGLAATASNNLQNMNSPGYALEVANVNEAPADFVDGSLIGGGAILGNVTEVRDPFIEAQLPSLLGQASSSSAESTALQALSAFNDGSNGNGLAEALSNFFSGLQALSSSPGDTSLREAAIGDATALAQAFNSASSNISSAQSGLDQQVTSNIGQINQLSSQMASLNQQISVAQAAGQSPNALLDQREQVETQLAQLTGAVPVPDAKGDLSMVLAGGQALVSGTQAATLSTFSDPNNGGHVGLQLSAPGASTITLQDSDIGGTIGGTLSARDGALATAASSLDELAYNLGTAFNTIQGTGYGTDGSTGNNFFDVGTSAAGAAASITVDPAVANNPAALAASSSATAPGDGSNLALMIEVQSQAMAGGSSPADALASIVSTFGVASQNAQSASTNDQAALTAMQTQQQSVSGVSSNDESIDLQQAQSLFQAVSQVIQTTDNMLQSIMDVQTTVSG